MRFVETPVFTKELRDILSDDAYRSIQAAIMLRPEQGAIIRGTGGIRKLRWSGKAMARVAACTSYIIGIRNQKQSTCYMHIQKASKRILPQNNVDCLAVSYGRNSNE